VGEGPVGGLEGDLEVPDHQDARLQEDPHPLQPGTGPWVYPFPPAGLGPRWKKNDDGKPPLPPSWEVSIGSFGAPLVPASIGSRGGHLRSTKGS